MWVPWDEEKLRDASVRAFLRPGVPTHKNLHTQSAVASAQSPHLLYRLGLRRDPHALRTIAAAAAAALARGVPAASLHVFLEGEGSETIGRVGKRAL